MGVETAAKESNGVAADHLTAIWEVCKKMDCFVFIRPSEKQTVNLIKAGFATKSMDVHEKSSDWGLHAGLVPQDPALSKKATMSKAPNPEIKPEHHGKAQSIQLRFDHAQFNDLEKAGQFGTPKKITRLDGCEGWSSEAAHYHFDDKRSDICMLLKDVGKGKEVFWNWRPGTGRSAKSKDVPVLVKAYNGLPVTGDYDLWMVAPHWTEFGKTNIETQKDDHGRSAAWDYTKKLNLAFNTACKQKYPNCQDVFNHGAEAQNFSFTQEMEKKDLVVCCPGNKKPFVVNAVTETSKLTGILHDLLGHGYVVVRNPKWCHGFTLGAEDMAFAPAWFLNYLGEGKEKDTIKYFQGEVKDLASGAATLIQRAIRVRRLRKQLGKTEKEKLRKEFLAVTEKPTPQLEKFRARAAELRLFREVQKIPEYAGTDKVLSKDHFYYLWPEGKTWRNAKARLIGTELEKNFRRTHFVLEGKHGHKHVAPIDQSKDDTDFPVRYEEDERDFYEVLYGKDWPKMYRLAKKRQQLIAEASTK